MEQIFKNLSDPSWWFTGLFFALLASLTPRLINQWIPKVMKIIPSLSRWRRKKTLLIIKNNRQKDMRIVWLIGRYWAVGSLCLTCLTISCIYFMFSTEHNLKNIFDSGRIFAIFPLYIILGSTVLHKATLDEVIKENHRLKKREYAI